MQSIEFKKPKEKWSQSVDDDVKDFMQIAKILVKSLEWKLTKQVDIDVIICFFHKGNTEVFLVYNEMDGIYLRTHDETFDLQMLFDEIDFILRKKTEKR